MSVTLALRKEADTGRAKEFTGQSRESNQDNKLHVPMRVSVMIKVMEQQPCKSIVFFKAVSFQQ